MPADKTGTLSPGVEPFVFPALASSIFSHGVFSRHGGVSPAPWDSRNVSFGLGDRPENVYVNRNKLRETLDFKHLVSTKQVHGAKVYVVAERVRHDLEIGGFDGLVTNLPDTGLMIQQADCQAILLADPVRGAVGIAHAGWRGTVANVIAETVLAMSRAFATEPADLVAGVSPSLGPCCAEFVNFRTELPAALHGYQVRPNHFDFWAISRDQLCSVGLRPGNIHIAGICTRCSRDYFSYRRERVTGRFASVIGLKHLQKSGPKPPVPAGHNR